MNTNYKYKDYFKKVALFNFVLLAVGLFFTTAVFAQTASSGDIPPELVSLAQDLNCNSVETCEAAFEADLRYL